MRSPWARSTTIEPTLPQPITPSVLLVISTPMKRFFSHLPAWVEASACGIWRASASMSEIACSAVVIELPKGVFITMMPLAVAAGISTLSTPIPARPITLRFFAFSRIFGVTFVAERIARPSNPPTSSASFSLSAPSLGWKSTSMPRSLKIWTAAGERASEMRTRGAMKAPECVGDDVFVMPPPRLRGGRRQDALRCLCERCLCLGKRPVDPRRQRRDIGLFDRATAPDAQTRRCVAMGRDVERGAFLLDERDEILHEGPLRVDGERPDRRIDDLEAHGCIRARRLDLGEVRDPRGLGDPVVQHLGVRV